jgi:hypothetical protein
VTPTPATTKEESVQYRYADLPIEMGGYMYPMSYVQMLIEASDLLDDELDDVMPEEEETDDE